MSENDFPSLYKTLPTARLLEIVDNAREYETSAVEAAQRELESRQLNNEQLDVERTDHAERQREFEAQGRGALAIVDRLKSVGLFFTSALNPIQTDTSIENKIKLIIVVLVSLFLYPIFVDFEMIRYMLTEGRLDFSFVHYFSSFIVLAGAGILLWLRSKFGWMLTVFFFTYTAMNAILLLRYAITIAMEQSDFLDQSDFFDTFFPIATPGVYLGTFLVFGAATWTMSTENFRKVFNVDKRTMFITIAVGMIAPALLKIAENIF